MAMDTFATVARVSASSYVQQPPSRSIDNERPNVTIPLGRFALCCRDVRWRFDSLSMKCAFGPNRKPLLYLPSDAKAFMSRSNMCRGFNLRRREQTAPDDHIGEREADQPDEGQG